MDNSHPVEAVGIRPVAEMDNHLAAEDNRLEEAVPHLEGSHHIRHHTDCRIEVEAARRLRFA